MKKRNKLGMAIAGVVLMATAGVPAGQAAEIAPLRASVQMADQPEGRTRFLVQYRAGSVESRDAAVLGRGLDAAIVRSGLDRMVVASSRSAERPAARARFMRRLASPGWNVIRTSRALNAVEVEAFIRELKADPAVQDVEIDELMQRAGGTAAAMVPADPDYAKLQWHFSDPNTGVHAEQAWMRSQGEGVVVAVIDTGISQGNPDLQGNVLPGYDMITDMRVSRRDSEERVPGGWDIGDWAEENYCSGWARKGPHSAIASSWHGTHVAGTIAQETNNGKGLAGLAHKAKVLPMRVLGACDKGYSSDIVDAIIWSVGGEVPGLPLNPNPAEVINMSLGGADPSPCKKAFQTAIDFAIAKGAIVVVAAGNINRDAGKYTMSVCNNVISVGASRFTGGKASYSNFGERVDLAAPGGDKLDGNPKGGIWQTINGGATQVEPENWISVGLLGTSMAAPHVTAAVAMIQSVAETPLTWTQMRDLLKETATPFPVEIPAETPMGAGILNINAALTKLLGERPCNPELESCGLVATPLVNKMAVNGLTGVAGSEVLYRFEAEAGKVLSFMSYGGSGDVSMYVSMGSEPTAVSHEARSVRSGSTSETVRFTAPKAGTYYLKLVGTTPYTGVTLVARQ